MCLIGFAWQESAEFPFALVANRDEFHARPTEHLHWWHDHEIAGGRDLQAGGTWLGINAHGRFAAITNYRDGTDQRDYPYSRGQLVNQVLTRPGTLDEVQAGVALEKNNAAGFNLLFGNLFGSHREIRFMSNRGPHQEAGSGQSSHIVKPGVYSFSNGPFDARWPKTEVARRRLIRALRHRTPAGFWEVLDDRDQAAAEDLPDTGVGPEIEMMLSPVFIVGEEYGTRSSHRILCRRHQEIDLSEIRYDAAGNLTGASNIRIKPDL